MSNHQSLQTVKLAIIAHSGMGKTGGLASLINRGPALGIKRFVIQDYDNGLDVLMDQIDPSRLEDVYYETLTDELKAGTIQSQFRGARSGIAVMSKGDPTAYARGMNLMSNWKNESEDLGPMSSWGNDTCLILDSATRMGDAALRYSATLNGRPAGQPIPGDYGDAMRRQQGYLERMLDAHVKCHVIVNWHYRYLGKRRANFQDPEDMGDPGKPWPSALGQELPPIVLALFNNAISMTITGVGREARREYITVPFIDPMTDKPVEWLKNTRPSKMPERLSIKDGLAKFFSIVLDKPLE